MELHFIILIALAAILAVCLFCVICVYCCGDYCYCREESSYSHSRDSFGGRTKTTASSSAAYSEDYWNSNRILPVSTSPTDLEISEHHSTPLLSKEPTKPPPLGFEHTVEQIQPEVREFSPSNTTFYSPTERMSHPTSNNTPYPPTSTTTETYHVERDVCPMHSSSKTYRPTEMHSYPPHIATETRSAEARVYTPHSSVKTESEETNFYPLNSTHDVTTPPDLSHSSVQTHHVQTSSYPSHPQYAEIHSYNGDVNVSRPVAYSTTSNKSMSYSMESPINSNIYFTNNANSHDFTNAATDPSTIGNYPSESSGSEAYFRKIAYPSDSTTAYPSTNASIKSVEQALSMYPEPLSYQSQTVRSFFRKHPSEVSLYDNM